MSISEQQTPDENGHFRSPGPNANVEIVGTPVPEGEFFKEEWLRSCELPPLAHLIPGNSAYEAEQQKKRQYGFMWDSMLAGAGVELRREPNFVYIDDVDSSPPDFTDGKISRVLKDYPTKGENFYYFRPLTKQEKFDKASISTDEQPDQVTIQRQPIQRAAKRSRKVLRRQPITKYPLPRSGRGYW